MTVDEFQGESGLKEDWDGTIVKAAFEQQGRGNWALVLVSNADDGEEVAHRPLSVGGADKGWTSYDGGETVMGASEKQRFHTNSSIQKFIDAAMKAGAEDELRRRSANLYDRRGPLHADLWLNLRFHWEVVEEKGQRQNQTTKEWEDTTYQSMMPTKFLGVLGTEGTSSPTQQAPSNITPINTPPASTPTTATGGSAEDIGGEDLVALKMLAKENDDWGAFADAVMGGKMANGEPFTKHPTIRKSLSKRDWWEELRA